MENFTVPTIQTLYIPSCTIKFYHIRDMNRMNIEKITIPDMLCQKQNNQISNIPFMDTSCDRHSQR